jgi:hypothetical protein
MSYFCLHQPVVSLYHWISISLVSYLNKNLQRRRQHTTYKNNTTSTTTRFRIKINTLLRAGISAQEKVGYEQNIFVPFLSSPSCIILPPSLTRDFRGGSLPLFRDFRSSIGVLAQNLEFLLLSLLSSLLSCFCCCCRCFVVVISVLDRHSRTTATEPCSLSVSTFQVGHCHNFGSFGPIYWCHRSRFGIFFSLLSSLLLGFCCCCRFFVVVICVLDRRWRTIATEPCSLLVCSWLIVVDFQFSTPDCSISKFT